MTSIYWVNLRERFLSNSHCVHHVMTYRWTLSSEKKCRSVRIVKKAYFWYLSRLGFLHAVLGTGWPLTQFVSEKETQARHQCVGCLIHGRRGAQLLAWLPCGGRQTQGGGRRWGRAKRRERNGRMCVSGGQKTEQQLILPQEKKQHKKTKPYNISFFIYP